MIAALLLSAIAVLPSDRFAMADRLFNRGRYQEAVAEYRALEGESSIAADALLFRVAECEWALGHKAEAQAAYQKLADGFPDSKHASRARLQLALMASGEVRRKALQALDSDRSPKEVRAAALYHLGTDAREPDLLARAVSVDPKGPYAEAAGFSRGALMAESEDPAVSRKGVELLLAFAFGKGERAEEALYLSAAQCYRMKRYGEAGSLFRRYRRSYPQGARLESVRKLAVWCDYLEGRYAEVLAACADKGVDDFAYLKAASTLATGDCDGAVRLFRDYLERFPAGAYRKESELALARQEFSFAARGSNVVWTVETAQRVYRQSKLPADGLRLGWAYTQANRANDAEALYRQLVHDNPDSAVAAEAQYARAMLAARAAEWSKAELLLAEALAGGKLGDRQASASYWRGVAAIRIGHETEARRFLTAALAARLPMDEDREARLMIADMDLKAGRVDEAKGAYLKLVSEGACERMSATRLKTVGELLGGEAQATCARELIKSESAEWRQAGWAMLGVAEEKKGAYSSAIEAYRAALAEPTTTAEIAWAALNLGKLEMRAGESERAEETLRRAVTLNAENARARAEAYLALAENAAARGDRKAAAGYATVVVSLFDDPSLTAAAEKILKANGEDQK